MLFKRFVLTSLILIVTGITFFIFDVNKLDLAAGDTYFVIDFVQLLFSAAISFSAPALLLVYIEIIQKKKAPPVLTRLSFILHLAGVLVLLSTIAVIYGAEDLRNFKIVYIFVYTGLFLAVAGMSLLPAILLIALRRR
jgi:heme/copper-type cytochrome/quinol oxidase subunit 1